MTGYGPDAYMTSREFTQSTPAGKEQTMTETKKAIQAFNDNIDDENGDYVLEDFAIFPALSALIEAERRENPRPLTLDELMERDGKPVWCVGVPDETGWDGWGNPLWMLVNTREESVQTGDESADFDNYGEWLAYDYPPKEARDDAN